MPKGPPSGPPGDPPNARRRPDCPPTPATRSFVESRTRCAVLPARLAVASPYGGPGGVPALGARPADACPRPGPDPRARPTNSPEPAAAACPRRPPDHGAASGGDYARRRLATLTAV